MKIYTRKGDAGETSLLSGRRAGKTDPAIAAAGDIDELSACLGMVRIAFPAVAAPIREIQRDLYVIGAVLSAEGRRAEYSLDQAAVPRMEAMIDAVSETLPELRDFIYPGETEAGTRCHLARAVARRAERGVAALQRPPAPPAVLAYLNRLSDLLFVWARAADLAGGAEAGRPGHDLPPAT